MKTPHRHAAFTLIELLTVIAIIGILAAIIIPVVGKVRESARKTQSLSNLRQIGQAVIMYAQDNRDRLVHAQNVPNSGDRFSNVLQNFMENRAPSTSQWLASWDVSDVYRCPAYDNPTQRWKTGFGMHMYLNAYLVSGDYSQTNQEIWYGRLLTTRFPTPSRTIIIGSTTDHVIDVRRTTGFAETNTAPNRHGNTANYLFLDGHVASLSESAALENFP